MYSNSQSLKISNFHKYKLINTKILQKLIKLTRQYFPESYIKIKKGVVFTTPFIFRLTKNII